LEIGVDKDKVKSKLLCSFYLILGVLILRPGITVQPSPGHSETGTERAIVITINEMDIESFGKDIRMGDIISNHLLREKWDFFAGEPLVADYVMSYVSLDNK